MKLIIAYVQPFLLDRVIDTLQANAGVSGATVAHARGFGRGRKSAGQEEEIYGTSARARIEVAANDDRVEPIIQSILASAHTGKRGDGKILVLPLERALRIQTREEGPGVLSRKVDEQ